MLFFHKLIIIIWNLNLFITEYVVMCNYPTWGRSRLENGTFGVEDVDVSMCTHIVYAYGGMDSIGNVFHGFVNDSSKINM